MLRIPNLRERLLLAVTVAPLALSAACPKEDPGPVINVMHDPSEEPKDQAQQTPKPKPTPIVPNPTAVAPADQTDRTAAKGDIDLGEKLPVPDRSVRCLPMASSHALVPGKSDLEKCAPHYLIRNKQKISYERGILAQDLSDAQAKKKPATANVCCYDTNHSQPMKGRPYVDNAGQVHVPDAVLGGIDADLEPDTLSSAAARGWLRDAQEEAASVPAFRRAADELSAVGGPRTLVERLVAAADDEVMHTALCLDMVESIAGERPALGVMPVLAPRVLDIAGVALATLHEGCIAEGLAAAIAAEAAARTDDEQARRVQTRIARDEAEHAALAFEVLTWTVSVGGSALADRILSAADASLLVQPNVHAERDDGAPYGRLAAATESDVVQATSYNVIWPAVRASLTRGLAGAPA